MFNSYVRTYQRVIIGFTRLLSGNLTLLLKMDENGPFTVDLSIEDGDFSIAVNGYKYSLTYFWAKLYTEDMIIY